MPLPEYVICNDDIKFLVETLLTANPDLSPDFIYSDQRTLECRFFNEEQIEIVKSNINIERLIIELQEMVEKMLKDNDLIHRIAISESAMGYHKTIIFKILV